MSYANYAYTDACNSCFLLLRTWNSIYIFKLMSKSIYIYKSCEHILSKLFWNISNEPCFCIYVPSTLIVTPLWHLRMVVYPIYLKLMGVWARESGWRMFLLLLANIKILVTVSYVMGKCWTGVFVSVFCYVRETIELPEDEVCPRDSAVSLHYLKLPNFTHDGEAKVFTNNVRSMYSASPKMCIFFVLKLSCVRVCTMFLP